MKKLISRIGSFCLLICVGISVAQSSYAGATSRKLKRVAPEKHSKGVVSKGDATPQSPSERPSEAHSEVDMEVRPTFDHHAWVQVEDDVSNSGPCKGLNAHDKHDRRKGIRESIRLLKELIAYHKNPHKKWISVSRVVSHWSRRATGCVPFFTSKHLTYSAHMIYELKAKPTDQFMEAVEERAREVILDLDELYQFRTMTFLIESRLNPIIEGSRDFSLDTQLRGGG